MDRGRDAEEIIPLMLAEKAKRTAEEAAKAVRAAVSARVEELVASDISADAILEKLK